MDIINIKDNSNKLFYIGGVVRDELLNRKSFDIDITYVGNAIDYCSQFGEVIQKNPDFGTVRVKLPISHSQEEGNSALIVDFASTRSESYPHKGHLPVVDKIGCSLKEDVMRRDFTINALAKSVTTGEIIDYTRGLEDLKNKKIRVLHDESFIDDPTRIIRALKFSVRFGFELEEHTQKLQEEYLSNINYDMSYKRLKKELIETFSLNSQLAFEKFINEGIYKLITPNKVVMPKVNIEELIQGLGGVDDKKVGCLQNELYRVTGLPSCPPALLPSNIWLVYVGVLGDLSRLPLTKTEQKILGDVPLHKLESDLELYKAFENSHIESVLLYAILIDEVGAKHYLENLKDIKISVTGKNLQELGLPPSPKYQEIFDYLLKEKLQNPSLTFENEMSFIKKIIKKQPNQSQA